VSQPYPIGAGTPDIASCLALMANRMQRSLTIAGKWLSRPWVVAVVLAYAVLWLVFDPDDFGWRGLATIATLLMTPFYPAIRTS
jgi:hypothetical protein